MDCTVDLQTVTGPAPHPERIWNTSLRFAPPKDIIERAVDAFGRPELVRIFITLDEFWDFRDDSFHDNFRIGYNRYGADDPIHSYDRDRTRASDVFFEAYLKNIGAVAQETLLCFRRYEHEVMNGTITWADYGRVLDRALRLVLRHCPQTRWVEITNESEWAHFGGLDDDAYIELYRFASGVIQKINAELPADRHLRIGGPVCSTSRKDRIASFLHRLRDAGDCPCDFISLHDYDSGERPNQVHDVLAEVRAQLADSHLPADLPIIVSECGTWEGNERSNENMAAGMPIILRQADDDPNAMLMPWCLYHDPTIQERSTMLLPDGRFTPYGCAMLMSSMHGEHELACHCPTRADGRGIHLRATRHDDGRLCIQAWNYEEATTVVRITLADLPVGDWRCRGFRIDAQHSNCLRYPEQNGTLACIEDRCRSAAEARSLLTELPANALQCWSLQPQEATP
ncbi:MAG: glycosyl hydrolase [Planctomycetota bacterium]